MRRNQIVAPETTEDHAWLRLDYQMCQNVADEQAASIWRSASILFPFLAAGAVFFLTRTESPQPLFFMLTAFLFLCALAVLFAWGIFAVRRQDVRRRMFDRQEEIERFVPLAKGKVMRGIAHPGITGFRLLVWVFGIVVGLLWLLATITQFGWWQGWWSV
ncbi:MAG: hypothetical protein Q7K03_01495 [Dehalococcoidia bacterium]|nr:hypothetical protein [Dehalococcoidia bacterium]